MIIVLHATGNALHVETVIIKQVPFYKSTDQLGAFGYKLLNKKNEELYGSAFPDPLIIHEDDYSDPLHPKGGVKRIQSNDILLKAPYLDTAERIQFHRTESEGKIIPMGTSKISPPY